MSEQTTIRVAEAMGWRFGLGGVSVPGEPELRKPGALPTVDDMLAWIMFERDFVANVRIECDYDHGVFVFVMVDAVNWRRLHGHTLHAALGAAVRAVAEAGDE